MRKRGNIVEMDIPVDAVQPIYSFEKKVVEAFKNSDIRGSITGVGTYTGVYAIGKEKPDSIIKIANLLDTLNAETIKEKILPLLFSKKAQGVSDIEESVALLSYIYLDFEANGKQGESVMELLDTTDMFGDKMWKLFVGYYGKDIDKLLTELHSGLDIVTAGLEIEEFLGNRGLSIREIGSEEL